MYAMFQSGVSIEADWWRVLQMCGEVSHCINWFGSRGVMVMGAIQYRWSVCLLMAFWLHIIGDNILTPLVAPCFMKKNWNNNMWWNYMFNALVQHSWCCYRVVVLNWPSYWLNMSQTEHLWDALVCKKHNHICIRSFAPYMHFTMYSAMNIQVSVMSF